MKISFSFVFFLFTALVNAQDLCPATKNGYVFQANRIGAFFSARGSKFFDFHNGYFKAPYTSEKSPSTIFACSPWMGGYVNNELRLTGQTYATPRVDLFTGPLGPSAVPYDNCYQFDRVWSVSRDEIEQHIQDYAMDGIIDDTLSNVFGWPAQGNSFFSKINGFDLPTDHQGGWADFADVNQNGIYEPQFGEYPIVYLKGQSQIPQLISWMVFNDKGEHLESKGIPLGIEFQLTVFGFNCVDNYVLNNALFNSYKIINQGADEIDSTYFGMWTDYDLGCASDDFLGSDSIRNTEFVYNDGADGDVGFDCSTGSSTYANYPPVQSMTYLSHPMHSLINYSRWYEGQFYTPRSPDEFYHLLSGQWPDGTPIAAHGNGYDTMNQDATTRFLYYGDPRDTTQWSEIQEDQPHVDEKPVSSVFLDTFKPGEITTIETAYSFHQDSSLNALEQVGFMYTNVDSLLKIVNDIGGHCQLLPTCIERDCVWPGDFNHDGIADHYDLLNWGILKEQLGSKRNGQINWTGHFADNWTLELPNQVNAKHGDGNGNGVINDEDLDRNLFHFLFTNPYYENHDSFPEGPEVVIDAENMMASGEIRSVYILMGKTVQNVLGLAYQFDIDTTLYYFDSPFNKIFCPADSNVICIGDNAYSPENIFITGLPRFAFVKTNHEEITLDSGFLLHRLFNAFKLRDGITLDDVPDTVVIRLKNLIALDSQGNDLHVGAMTAKVPKYDVTATTDADSNDFQLYPNPANNTLSIETELNSDILIFNLQGQLLKKIHSSDIHQPVDISSLAPGLYFLKFTGYGGSYKFVKQ
jgi:hypothetical protein